MPRGQAARLRFPNLPSSQSSRGASGEPGVPGTGGDYCGVSVGLPRELHTLGCSWRGPSETPAPLPLPTRGQETLFSKTERGDNAVHWQLHKDLNLPPSRSGDLPATSGDFPQSWGHSTRPVPRARLPAIPAPQGCPQQEQDPVQLRCIAGSWANGSGPRIRPGSKEVPVSSDAYLDLDEEVSPLTVYLQGGTPAPHSLHTGWMASSQGKRTPSCQS